MRAASDDKDAAQLMGIDNKRIYAIATAIALAHQDLAGRHVDLVEELGDLLLLMPAETAEHRDRVDQLDLGVLARGDRPGEVRSHHAPHSDSDAHAERHRDGILRWFDSKIANGLIEGINSLVQAAKAKARGYRSLRNLVAMTYLIAGKLDLKLPT